MEFYFLVDPKGTVVLLDYNSKPYPSVSVFSYVDGMTSDLAEKTESSNPNDLNMPMRDMMNMIPHSDLQQLEDRSLCSDQSAACP
jgi:hypothetical protein